MVKARKKPNEPPAIAKKVDKKRANKILTRAPQDLAKSDKATTRLCFLKLRRIKLQPLAAATLPQALQMVKTRTAALRDQCVNSTASTAPHAKTLAQPPILSPIVTRKCAINLRRSTNPEPITKEGSPTALREQRVSPRTSAVRTEKLNAAAPVLKQLVMGVKQATVNDQVPHSNTQTNAINSGSKRNGIREKENITKVSRANAFKQVKNGPKQLSIPTEENASTCGGRGRRRNAQDASTTVATENQKSDLHESLRRNEIHIKHLSISQRNGLKKLSLSGVSTRSNADHIVRDHRQYTAQTTSRTNAVDAADGGSNDISTGSENSQLNTSAKNIANDNDAIEKMLFSEEDDEEASKESNVQSKAIQKPANALAVTAAKTHKFFHRTGATAANNKCNVKTRPKVATTARNRRARPRYTVNRRVSKGNIYEFLSQSQTSDSDPGKHIDPAADIIKKLIAEGKVRVATTRKGTGRPVIKRVLKRVVKKRVAPMKWPQRKKNMSEKADPAAVEEDNFDFGAASISPPQSPIAEEQEIEKNTAVEISSIPKSNNHNQSADGTFSRLARSVLLQQAGKNSNVRKRSILDQQKLLDVARKFVSTPVNRAKSATLQTANISPIAAPKLSTANKNALHGMASPWRVPDEAHMPSVFHFSHNSSQLPSFSSDFIPPTPRKNVQFAPLEYSKSRALEESDIPSTSAQAAANALLAQQSSSFTLNDSDVENVPPLPHASTGSVDPEVDANADIFNLRQQPNPRRTYSHRSPLKAINILEVVTLPPWHPTTDGAEKPAQKEKPSHTDDESNIEHLFGFDEFIDHDESDEEAQSKLSEASLATSYVDPKNLRKKLHDLKKWRPAVENLLREEPKEVKPIRRIYDDVEGGQRGIKEMLCSTMINQRKTKETGRVDSDEDDSAEEHNNGQRRNTNNGEAGLFNDPEITFKETQSRRTYGRQYKKKRKLRHNFVMFLDSDESGEEEGAEDQSHEQNKSDEKEKKRTRKRQKPVRKEEKSNPELESFVHSFNDMCQEVEQYELIVE